MIKSLNKGQIYKNEYGAICKVIEVNNILGIATYKIGDTASCVSIESANNMLNFNGYKVVEE